MELIPIEVICYSGYKADEYPKNFIWEDISFDIIEIIDRWYEGYNKPGSESANYFKVRTSPTGTYLIKQELKGDRWFLVV